MLSIVTKLLSLFGDTAPQIATSPLVTCCPAGDNGGGNIPF